MHLKPEPGALISMHLVWVSHEFDRQSFRSTHFLFASFWPAGHRHTKEPPLTSCLHDILLSGHFSPISGWHAVMFLHVLPKKANFGRQEQECLGSCIYTGQSFVLHAQTALAFKYVFRYKILRFRYCQGFLCIFDPRGVPNTSFPAAATHA